MKRVLDVGNCDMDHGTIAQMIQANFEAEVDRAHALVDALPLLGEQEYDLVMVNRLLDGDGSSGMDVIAQVRQSHPGVPVMLITNFAEHQDTAVASGAVPGFGKRAVDAQQTIELLSVYLAS